MKTANPFRKKINVLRTKDVNDITTLPFSRYHSFSRKNSKSSSIHMLETKTHARRPPKAPVEAGLKTECGYNSEIDEPATVAAEKKMATRIARSDRGYHREI
jgi:hypothetical protein